MDFSHVGQLCRRPVSNDGVRKCCLAPPAGRRLLPPQGEGGQEEAAAGCNTCPSLFHLRAACCPCMQGEDQKKLDVIANEVFKNSLRRSGQCCILVRAQRRGARAAGAVAAAAVCAGVGDSKGTRLFALLLLLLLLDGMQGCACCCHWQHPFSRPEVKRYSL